MKIFAAIFTFFIMIVPYSLYANEQSAVFQDMVKTILETGGKMKEITDTLRPNTRLYIYKQLPSMKEKINESEKVIMDIKKKAAAELNNRDMQNVIQDMASIQLLTINVAKDLLTVYEKTGAISQKDYKSVIAKYENEAMTLQKSLERYKNM